MEESAIKGLKLLDLNDRDAHIRDTRIMFSEISVEGYDTSLPTYAVKLTLRKCFASCGEILDIRVIKRLKFVICGIIPPIFPAWRRVALVRFVGEGAQEKALTLDGTDVGGWIPNVKAEPWQSNHFGSSSVPRNQRCMVFVSGYDTGLAKFDIQIALCKHFSSCGEVTRVTVLPSSRASILIEGERCEEKVLHLNGSVMGGMNLVVEPPNEHSGRPRKFASRKTPSVLLVKKKIKKEMKKIQNEMMKKLSIREF